ncbi:MAG: DUF4352 domain-containing protein [Chloroflexota bacterium]|nr:DUF4352 domain-containing protein [Chloroflexota bacterium]
MRKIVGGPVAVGLLAFLLIPQGAGPVAATEGSDPLVDVLSACEAAGAGVDDLQSQVALLLKTEVPTDAEPGEALAGRLGGTREEIVAAYGDPVLYLGPDLVGVEVGDLGQTIVEFARDRVVQIILLPDRPGDKPSTEPDPADWSLDVASALAERFLPADATLDETRSALVDNGLVVVGCSAALGAALEDSTAGGALDAEAVFSVRYTMPTPQTVSAITIALRDAHSAGEASSPLSPTPTDDDDGTTTSVSRSSSEQNGIRVTFLGSDLDAEGTESLAPGKRYVAVEVTIENRSNETLRYTPDDFQVTDSAGRAYPAVEGGADPAITGGELAPGDAIRGWISFEVPEDADPERFVYTRQGSTMRFGLP